MISVWDPPLGFSRRSIRLFLAVESRFRRIVLLREEDEGPGSSPSVSSSFVEEYLNDFRCVEGDTIVSVVLPGE